MTALFREEALANVGAPKLGPVVLVSALSHWMMAAFGATIVAAIVLALTIGEYTRHVEVAGTLRPEGGDIKVYLPRPGVVQHVAHRPGDHVRKGEVLLRMSTEHEGAAGADLETTLLQQSREKLQSLRAELEASTRLQAREASAIQLSQANTQLGREALAEQASMLEARIASARATLAEHQQLLEAGFEAEQVVRQKRDAVVELQLRLAAIRRELVSTDEEIARLRQSAEQAPLKQRVDREQLERSMVAVQAELAQRENDHEWSVTSPCDGTVLSISVADGQTATPGVALVTLLPHGAGLQGRLYAPSRDAGFIKTGQALRLKLDAYPFQKFGTLGARVVAVAGAPTSANDIASVGSPIGARAESEEPLYAIDVELDAQSIEAYGVPHPLVSGMQLTGDLPLESRRLYEWVLEPLFAMRHR